MGSIPTPYQGAKSNSRVLLKVRPNLTTVQAGGSAAAGSVTRPSASRSYSTCAVDKSVLMKTLRLPIYLVYQIMKFIVIGQDGLICQFVDQVQIHHRGLDGGVSQLALEEHYGFDLRPATIALKCD